jgi:hypothetical protein
MQAYFGATTNTTPSSIGYDGDWIPNYTSLWPFEPSYDTSMASVYQWLLLGSGPYYIIHFAMYATPNSGATIVLLEGCTATVDCGLTGVLISTPLTDTWTACPSPYSASGVSYSTMVFTAQNYSTLAAFADAIVAGESESGFLTEWPLTFEYGPDWNPNQVCGPPTGNPF